MILPERAGETDDEKRLREAINRQCAGILTALDSAIKLRSAKGPAQRARNVAKRYLENAALWAMQAYSINTDSAEE